jgi:hypothetical protein
MLSPFSRCVLLGGLSQKIFWCCVLVLWFVVRRFVLGGGHRQYRGGMLLVPMQHRES